MPKLPANTKRVVLTVNDGDDNTQHHTFSITSDRIQHFVDLLKHEDKLAGKTVFAFKRAIEITINERERQIRKGYTPFTDQRKHGGYTELIRAAVAFLAEDINGRMEFYPSELGGGAVAQLVNLPTAPKLQHLSDVSASTRIAIATALLLAAQEMVILDSQVHGDTKRPDAPDLGVKATTAPDQLEDAEPSQSLDALRNLTAKTAPPVITEAKAESGYDTTSHNRFFKELTTYLRNKDSRVIGIGFGPQEKGEKKVREVQISAGRSLVKLPVVCALHVTISDNHNMTALSYRLVLSDVKDQPDPNLLVTRDNPSDRLLRIVDDDIGRHIQSFLTNNKDLCSVLVAS